MRIVLLTLTAVALAIPATASWAQDLAAGEQSFKKCLACHAVGEGATNKVGPSLNGLDGRKSGTIPGYNYSDANKKAELVWNEAVFRDYIKNPMGKIPGTKMAFPGIRNETEIGNLWAYLKQFGADGKIK
jgi:cytochrome c